MASKEVAAEDVGSYSDKASDIVYTFIVACVIYSMKAPMLRSTS